MGERTNGRVYRIPAGGGERTLVGTVPGVVPDGEGGLLGLAVDPLFIHDSFVYAYLTAEADNRIIRFATSDDAISSPTSRKNGTASNDSESMPWNS